MPGEGWLSFARRWLDEGVVDRTIEPLVADWLAEREQSNGLRRCRLDCLWAAAFAYAIVRGTVSPLKGDFMTGTRQYVATVAVGCLASVAGMLGFALLRGARAATSEWLGVIGFIVWNLMIFVPLAVMPATAALSLGASRRRIAGLVFATILALVPLVGWIGPAGERARLDATIRERASRGLETRQSSIDLAMPLPELWLKRNSAEILPGRAALELNRRAALIAWAASFALLGAVLVARGRGRTMRTRLGWWVATTAMLLAVWFALMTQSRNVVPIWFAPWVMVAIVLGAAAALTTMPKTRGADPDAVHAIAS